VHLGSRGVLVHAFLRLSALLMFSGLLFRGLHELFQCRFRAGAVLGGKAGALHGCVARAALLQRVGEFVGQERASLGTGGRVLAFPEDDMRARGVGARVDVARTLVGRGAAVDPDG
jgi:hypothetical protein